MMITNKKADVGWSFIVKMVIGLLILLALIFVAVAAKKGFGTMFGSLGNLFG